LSNWFVLTPPQTLAVRARNAHPEDGNQQIASAVGATDRTVRTWHGRWVKMHSLAEAPRGGSTKAYFTQVRAQVTAIACSLPKESQVPLSRWSRGELARWVAQAPTPPPISASTGGRWLQAERIRPWRYHAWQHIHGPQIFL
jgi:Homeodomain-like domain